MSTRQRYKTIVNGNTFVGKSYVDTTLGRRFAAALERGHDHVDRIDPGTLEVTVWLEAPETGRDMHDFDIPDGWAVETVDAFGDGTVALIVKPDDTTESHA